MVVWRGWAWLGVVVAAVVLSGARDAPAAALGPGAPPPGVEAELWRRMWQRADNAARRALEGRSEQDQECGRAKLLLTLYNVASVVERALSQAKPTHVARIDTAKGEEARKELARRRDDSCGPRQGLGGGVSEALRDFAAAHPDWDQEPGWGPPLYPESEPLQRAAERAELRRVLQALPSMPSAAQGPLLMVDPDAAGVRNPVRERSRTDGL